MRPSEETSGDHEQQALNLREECDEFPQRHRDDVQVTIPLCRDELIKVKNFNPMTRVDLSREERMAKYDRLTEEMLNVFKQDRLKKYAALKSTEN